MKVDRSLEWLQMNLPQTAWKNGMEHLVEGVATGEVEILLVVSGFDVD